MRLRCGRIDREGGRWFSRKGLKNKSPTKIRDWSVNYGLFNCVVTEQMPQPFLRRLVIVRLRPLGENISSENNLSHLTHTKYTDVHLANQVLNLASDTFRVEKDVSFPTLIPFRRSQSLSGALNGIFSSIPCSRCTLFTSPWLTAKFCRSMAGVKGEA